MKINIGVTAYNRPKHLDLWRKQIQKHTSNSAIFIADDGLQRRGIAYRKNECLRAFDGDYLFLFDDDCFPVKDGWAEYFIEMHKATGQHHFLYLKETPSIKKIGTSANINIYNNSGGVFMFLTKEAVKAVGAFDERYEIYGFEHADYTRRIHDAGLTTMGKYLCPNNAGEYIYALDYDNYESFNKDVLHRPSMGVVESIKYINKNQELYNQLNYKLHLPL